MNAARSGRRAWTFLRPAALAVLVAVLFPAADLAAQACRGVPLTGGALAVSGARGFTAEADSRWGGEAVYGLTERVTLAAGYRHTGFEGATPAESTDLHLRATAGGTVTGERGGLRLALCAAASVRRERYGELRVLSVPLGLPAALEVPIGRGWSGVIHLEPRTVYTHGEIADHSSSALSPGLRGGATITFDRFFLGATHTWVRAERANRSTALALGLRLGGRR